MPRKPLLRYWIPTDMRPLAVRARAVAEGAALRLAVDTGDVVQAFLEYAWVQWKRGDLAFLPRLNPRGRKARLTLVWKEADGVNGATDASTPSPPPPPSQADRPAKPTHLGYRMPDAAVWDKRIREVAEEHDLPIGAVFLALFAHGAEAYQEGRLLLRTYPLDAIHVLEGWEKTNLHRTPEPALNPA